MKKTQLILAFCAMITFSKSQLLNYAQTRYLHNNTFLTDGKNCSLNSDTGYMMVGVNLAPSLGDPNFYIDRVDIDGSFTHPFTFSKEYKLSYHPNMCTGSLTQPLSMFGVSMIETNLSSPTRHYAIAGAIGQGAFFATLDASGAPANYGLYRFPSGAGFPSKPLIVETTTAGVYLICGSYSITSLGVYMYVIKVNAAGTVLNSNTYQVNPGIQLIPRSIKVSPYALTELVVVGRAEKIAGGTPVVTKPFFMRIDISNLSSLSCRLYGQTNQNTGVEWFNALDVATSTKGGSNGFVVAGYSDSIAASPVLAMKLNPTGNIVWNNLFGSSSTSSPILPQAVIERPNSFLYNNYYFIASESNVGMMVMKLDNSGNAFTSSLPIDQINEFHYNIGTSAPVALSYTTAGPHTGIQVFGNVGASGTHWIVRAPFNGNFSNTCPQASTTNIGAQNPGPPNSHLVNISTTSGLSLCSNFAIISSFSNIQTQTGCPNNNIPIGGSNNKEMATGINESQTETNLLNTYPNPVTEKMFIEIKNNEDTKLNLALYDNLGRFIINLEIPKVMNGKQTLEIDLEKYSLEDGVYFLKGDLNGKSYNQKVVYLKE